VRLKAYARHLRWRRERKDRPLYGSSQRTRRRHPTARQFNDSSRSQETVRSDRFTVASTDFDGVLTGWPTAARRQRTGSTRASDKPIASLTSARTLHTASMSTSNARCVGRLYGVSPAAPSRREACSTASATPSKVAPCTS